MQPAETLTQRVIRILLALTLCGSIALGGWTTGPEGATSLITAGLAAMAAVGLWFGIGAPGDPAGPTGRWSIPGSARLGLEWLIIIAAFASLWIGWNRSAAETLLTAVIIHAGLGWERAAWLLGRRRSG